MGPWLGLLNAYATTILHSKKIRRLKGLKVGVVYVFIAIDNRKKLVAPLLSMLSLS